MLKILDSQTMKRCDSHTIENIGIPSRELMERAARRSLDVFLDGGFDLTHVTVVCGAGNNGGDGMAMAFMLHERGIGVDVVFAGDPESCTEETKFRLDALRTAGVRIMKNADFYYSTAIIDALFGIGVTRRIEGDFASLIENMN